MRIVVTAPADWINSNQRHHRFKTAELTRAWRRAGRDAAADAEPVAGSVRIVAHIWKDRAGRYDPNNLWPTVKAVVDGFVDAGLLADDDHQHVTGPDMRHGGKGKPRLEIDIY